MNPEQMNNNMSGKPKKILLIILLFIIVAAIVLIAIFATGNKDNDNNLSENTSDILDNDNSSSDDKVTDNSQNKDKEIIKVFKIPGRDIYFSANVNWLVDEDTLVTMLYENKDCMVAVCYNRISEFNGNYEDMISTLSKNLISEASIKSQGYIRNSKLELTSKEMTNVAGYDSMKFTGKINNDDMWDCNVYGYAYVIDGVNLAVIGLVSAPEQDKKMIEDINTLTDYVARSVRTQE